MWWLRSRLVFACLLTLIATNLILVIFGARTIPLPSLIRGSEVVPLAFLVPVAVAVAVGAALGRGPQIEAVATRRLRYLDVGLCWLLALGNLAVAFAVDPLVGEHLARASARNAVALVGLTLLAHRLVGRNASTIPAVGYLIASSLVGSSSDGSLRWWAIPIAPPGSADAAVFAAGLFVLGTVAYVRPA